MVLKHLRKKKTAKKIWIALILIILPAFLFWGFGSVSRSRSKVAGKIRCAGTIFGKPVSFQEYTSVYNAIVSQNIMRWGEENFQKLVNYVDLNQATWDRLILLKEADKNKIRVTDEEVAQAIETNPTFQRKGQFDLKTYKEILQFVLHIPARTFEEQVRQNLTILKLYEKITAAVKLTEAQIKDAYKKENQEISLDYIVANFSDLSQEIKISEAEVEEYYKNSAKDFVKPLYLNIDYLKIEYPKDDEETKSIEEKINNIALELEKNTDITEIAKKFSLTLQTSGLFAEDEPIPGIGEIKELTRLISQLKIGQTSQLIYTREASYIIRLKEKKTSYLPPFTQIKDKVRDKLLKIKSEEEAKKRIDTALKKLKQTAHFFKVAKETNLKAGSTDLFKRNDTLKEIADSKALFEEGLNLKIGQISDIIKTAEGFYVIRLREVVPIDEEKFQKEKEEFSKMLLEEEKEIVFNDFFTALKTRANLKDNLANLKIPP